jgi:hypothetical protein
MEAITGVKGPLSITCLKGQKEKAFPVGKALLYV